MLDAMPAKAKRRPAHARLGRRLQGRPQSRSVGGYPWELWEDGEWWLIKRGQQFQCTLAGMRSTLRSRAARRGATVEVVLRPDDPSVPAAREHLYLAFRFHAPG